MTTSIVVSKDAMRDSVKVQNRKAGDKAESHHRGGWQGRADAEHPRKKPARVLENRSAHPQDTDSTDLF